MSQMFPPLCQALSPITTKLNRRSPQNQPQVEPANALLQGIDSPPQYPAFSWHLPMKTAVSHQSTAFALSLP